MSVPRSVRPVLLAFAAGCAPMTLALALPGQPSPPAAPASTLQVARLLDSIAQSRFQDTNMKVFGMSRIVLPPDSPTGRHIAFTFTARNPEETSILRSVEAARRDYMVSFLHCATVPYVLPDLLSPRYSFGGPSSPMPHGSLNGPDPLILLTANPQGSLTPLFLHSQTLTSDSATIQFVQERERLAATRALPALLAGREVQTAGSDWTVLMRPVLAAQDSCLGCHTTAKKNDTLGVMVYAVHNTPTKLSALAH